MKKAVFIVLALCAFAFAAHSGAFAQPNKTSGFLPVGDGKIYYETAGSGKTIVFIHGGFVDSRSWDKQFDEFARDYRVVRYDIRGRGRSPLPTEPFSFDQDLNRLFEFLKIERATVVGLSLGGIVAADFALERPEKVESLVLVGAGLRGFDFKLDDATRNIFLKLKTATADEMSRLWIEHQYFAGLRNKRRKRETMRRWIADNNRAFTEIDEAKFYRLPEPVTIERLDKIAAPTLVIVGELDYPVIIDIAKTLKAKISNSELVTMPEASHHPNFENPTEFNRILRRFLRKHV